MVADLFEFEDVRIRYPGTTAPVAYTAGTNVAWDVGTATKLRHVNGAINLASLSQLRVPNREVRSRRRGRASGTGLMPAEGEFSLDVGFNSSSTQNAILTLLSKILLGLTVPTANSDALDASGVHTADRLYAAGIEGTVAPGQAVLVGVRGDARGGGQVRPIRAEGTDFVDLTMSLPAAPADADAIWLSHTVFPDPTVATEFIEFLLIGRDGRQINAVGCQCTGMSLSGLGTAGGEEPTLSLTFMPIAWRWEPTASLETISDSAPSGAPSPQNIGLGGIFHGDHGYTSTAAYQFISGGDVQITPNFAYRPRRSPEGSLGPIVNWTQERGICEYAVKAYSGVGTPVPFPQYVETDFDGDTKMQLIVQLGAAADYCAAIELPASYIDQRPRPAEFDGFGGMQIEGHADEHSGTGLLLSDFRFHFFEA